MSSQLEPVVHTFTCLVCNERFASLEPFSEAFTDHVEQHRIEQGDYACNICGLPVCDCDRIHDAGRDR